MRFFEWIQKRSNGRKIGKSDWIILILVGVLLMVVVWPTGSSGDSSGGNSDGSETTTLSDNAANGGSSSAVAANEFADLGIAGSDSDSDADANANVKTDTATGDLTDAYASSDESTSGGSSDNNDGSEGSSNYISTLEDELAEVLSAMEGVGEVCVMITLEDDGEIVLQTDSSKSEDSSSDSTVIMEQGDDELPYITSRITPSVQGVVVVAEGAGSGSVDAEITEAVMALFGIEAHKVKVLPMG